MSKDKLTDYDATASNNTDVGGISIAEGMLPSAVNNAIREQMSHLKDFAAGTAGIDVLSLADDDASHAIKLQAPSSVTANTTFTLPDGDGDAGAMLKTDGAGQLGWSTAYRSSNLIINGAMTVDQRNQTTTATGYTVDRFNIAKTNFDELVIAVTQDTDNPSGNGFAHSLKLAVTTAESALGTDELLYFDTRLEGQNIQHLCYGTSSAKSLTLSFWVKSPLAGKHSLTFYQPTPVRSNLQSYTVSSANTWEYKTITIDGDTSGNIVNDNSPEMYVFWPLAGGSDYHGTPHTGWGAYTATDDFMFSDQVNLAGQTGNFFLTGIQLEVGDVATPFEHDANIGTTLAKCRRYYQGEERKYLLYYHSSASLVNVDYQEEMRAAPSVTFTSSNGSPSAGNIGTQTCYFVISSAATGYYADYTMDAEL